MEKEPFRDLLLNGRSGSNFSSSHIIVLILFLLNIVLLLQAWPPPSTDSIAVDLIGIRKCAIETLHSDLSFLDKAFPINADEYLERRDRLARALFASGADAFVLEPGYTFQ